MCVSHPEKSPIFLNIFTKLDICITSLKEYDKTVPPMT